MSLSENINQELDRLSDANLSESHPQAVDIPASHGRVTIELTEVNRLACAFQHFALRTDSFGQAGQDDLKQIGRWLAEKVNYLLEPIASVELDGEGLVLQMRSTSPSYDSNCRSYYELTVRPASGIQLVRYQKRTGHQRTLTPVNVTREVLVRLADDFDAAAGRK